MRDTVKQNKLYQLGFYIDEEPFFTNKWLTDKSLEIAINHYLTENL